jgi:hypothetical protein
MSGASKPLFFDMTLISSLLLAQQAVKEGPKSPTGLVAAFALLFIVLFILVNYFTRTGSIARATLKEAIRQPVFILLAIVGVIVGIANYYLPFFSLGDDTKMFIDCGLATTLICSLILTVWTASLSVAEEIEGKTAITLLSKPVTRREFILGKYVGILQAAFWMIVIVGVAHIFLTYFKFAFDQKETGKELLDYFEWRGKIPYPQVDRWTAAMSLLPGLILIFFESAVMAAVSVAISTRMPMIVNMTACFSIFILGHLMPVLVKSALQDVPFVPFVAQFFATVLPALENFNMSAAVSTGKIIPGAYILSTGAYAVAYSAAIVLLAFILFEDRDLA